MGCTLSTQRGFWRDVDYPVFVARARVSIQAQMRSGSVNVMYVTFGDFTRLIHFHKLLQAFNPAEQRRRIASKTP